MVVRAVYYKTIRTSEGQTLTLIISPVDPVVERERVGTMMFVDYHHIYKIFVSKQIYLKTPKSRFELLSLTVDLSLFLSSH